VKSIVVTNQKGGVAKTTICTNLAVGIIRYKPDTKILMVDIDPQGSLTYHFVKQRDEPEIISKIFGVDDYTRSDIIYRTRYKNIDIIPSDIKLSGKEFIAGQIIDGHRRLSGYLEKVRGAYDLAIIDTPPSLGFFSVNALMAATHVVIPFVPEKLSIIGLNDMLATIKKMTERTKREIKVIGIMPVIVDFRYKSHKQIIKKLKSEFPDYYREDLMVNTNAPLKDASTRRKSIYEYDFRAKSYKQFSYVSKAVYDEVLGDAAEEA